MNLLVSFKEKNDEDFDRAVGETQSEIPNNIDHSIDVGNQKSHEISTSTLQNITLELEKMNRAKTSVFEKESHKFGYNIDQTSDNCYVEFQVSENRSMSLLDKESKSNNQSNGNSLKSTTCESASQIILDKESRKYFVSLLHRIDRLRKQPIL